MKKAKTKILTSVFALVTVSLRLFLGISSNVMADGAYDGDYLLKKALVQDLYSCYEGGYMQTSIDISNFNNISSVSTDTGHSTVKLPNNLTGISDNNVGCQELLGGYSGAGGEFAGLIPGYLSDLAPISNNSMKTQLLEKLGYQANQNSTQTIRCATFSFDVSLTQSSGVSTNTYTAPSICAYVDGSNNIINNSLYQSGTTGSWAQASSLPDPVSVTATPGGIYSSSDGIEVPCNGGSFDDCVNNVYDNFLTIASMYADYNSGSQNTAYVTGKHVSFATSGGEITEYAMATPQPYIAAINIFGSSDRTFTTPEVISLYQRYLNDYATTQCTSESATADALIANGYSGPFTGVVDGQKVEGCYAKFKDEYSNPTFYGVSAGANNSLWNWSQENKSFADIIDFLSNQSNSNTHGLSDIISLTASNNDGQGTVDDETGDGDSDCYNNAGALGWILCPIISTMRDTVEKIYEEIVTPFLRIDVNTFDIGDSNGVYEAWQYFQTIANVIFVIIFLVTIISQITGFGIDNYGVKRLLPKLIVAAILVNLSYIICMLLVDASNIIGAGVSNIFPDIKTGGSAISAGQSAVSMFALAGTAAVGGTVLALNPALIVPLILGLIGILFSVLFMFILLGVRQAGVVILVAIAPVVIVMYMLPNTKQYFDKWRKLFQALLFVYPLCGLLIGGGDFAGKVILSADNLTFWSYLIGALLSVVPFFFIPTLLRGSMSAAGNIGARITGLGQNLGRGAQQRVGNSQAVQDFQKRAAAGIDRNGNMTTRGKLMSKIASGNSRFSKIPGLQRTAQLSQARSMANYQKMLDEMDFASRPELIAQEAEARRFKRRQDAEDAKLVNSGIANRTGDVKNFTSADDFEKGTLAYAAIEAARSGNVEAQYAATERMLASGHHGAEAYRQVMQALEQEGNVTALENFAKAGKNSRYTGDLKSGARSTFDYINGVTNGNVLARDANGRLTGAINSGQRLQDYVSKTKFANMSEAQLFNTDNEELARYAETINEKRKAQSALSQAGGTIPDNLKFSEQELALISQANKAYNNERLRGNAKESRQNLVAEIAGIRVPEKANPNDAMEDQNFSVQGGNSSNNSGGQSFSGGAGI